MNVKSLLKAGAILGPVSLQEMMVTAKDLGINLWFFYLMLL